MIEVLKQFTAPASVHTIRDRVQRYSSPKASQRPPRLKDVEAELDRMVEQGLLRKMTLRIEGPSPCFPKPTDEVCYILTSRGRMTK